MGSFWLFIEKSGTSLSTTFCILFFKKIFLMLYSFNWLNFIVYLPLFLEIVGNMCIVIICRPIRYVINFEINHIFLINMFFYESAKLRALRHKNVLACQRALRVYVPTFQRALCAHVPACLACLRAHVPMSLACLRLSAHVPTCFALSRASVSCVLT